MKNSYYDFRRNLINNYNISLIQHIVNIFTKYYKQELEALTRFQHYGIEDKLTDVKIFCESFYGIASLEWVKICFKSGLTVELAKDAKLLMLGYKGPNDNYAKGIRTESTKKIEQFLKENNLI